MCITYNKLLIHLKKLLYVNGEIKFRTEYGMGFMVDTVEKMAHRVGIIINQQKKRRCESKIEEEDKA